MRTEKTAHLSKREPTFGNKQNKTRTFIRKMTETTKNVARKTKSFAKRTWKPVAVTATAAALYFTLNSDLKAQDYIYASNIDSTKITAGMIPREGKLKVELKDGYVHFTNLTYPSGKKENSKIDVKKEMEIFNGSKLIEEKIVTLEDMHVRYYAIYENGVLTTTPRENEASIKAGTRTPDGKKFLAYTWTQNGAFYGISADGITAFATNDKFDTRKLSDIFKTPFDLKEPRLEHGPDNSVDLMAESLINREAGVYVRVRITATDTEFKWEVLPDKKITSR